MATEPKIGDIVPFDCCGTTYMGRIEDVTPEGEYLVSAGMWKDNTYVGSWVSREELMSAKYPYGEYIPTEGFDVARMPRSREDGLPAHFLCRHTNGLLYSGEWYGIGAIAYFDGQDCEGENLATLFDGYTHLYIVPPLATK